MSKYRFSVAQKQAIYSTLGSRCIWCTGYVAYKDCVIDHIIPESIKPQELSELIKFFKLPTNFNINSFYNWGPIHDSCNRKKSARTFKAPFIGALLHEISNKVPEILLTYKNIERELKNTKSLAHLEFALQNNQITRHDVEAILGVRKGTLNIVPPGLVHRVFNCKTTMIIKNGHYGRKIPRQEYDINYEQFDSSNESLTELNCIIEATALETLLSAREHYINYLKEYNDNDFHGDSFEGFWMNFSHAVKNFISYTTTINYYHTGTAHGQYAISGHSYYLNPLRRFHLEALIENYDAFKAKILPLAYNKMIAEIKKTEPKIEVDDNHPIDKNWMSQKSAAFNNYHFTQDGLTFIFNPYEVSAWSYGAQFPEFSFKELLKLFPKEKRLAKFILEISKKTKFTQKHG